MDIWSKSNIRGLAILLPLVLLLALAVWLAEPTGRFDTQLADEWEQPCDSVVLQPFDPNTADVFELCAAGMTRMQAVSVIKYREAGKVYRIKEDLLTVYSMTDSLYRVLKPYIEIAPEYRIVRRDFGDRTPRFRRDTVGRLHLRQFATDTLRGEHLREILGFTSRQAEAFDVYIRRRGSIRNADELRECYLLADWADTLAPYVVYVDNRPADPFLLPIEINTADSATLRRIYGIGERSVGPILDYRRRLGGFVRVEQLAEIPQVLESNYEKILQQICIDTCKIRKIHINFAPADEIGRHPYVQPRTLRRLLKQRQLKGGWTAIEDMVDANIITHAEAERLAPYLRFDTIPPNNTDPNSRYVGTTAKTVTTDKDKN